MAKDPAFLFYSNDFYSGTRTMLPEERACYIDLLVYQHQNGEIPNDSLDRIAMFCSGINKEVVKHVLEAKFKQTSTGWKNTKLQSVIDERKKHKPYKIASATLGGLISSSNLSENLKKELRKRFNIEDFIECETVEEIKEKVKEWFKHQLSICLTIYEDEIENEIKDENEIKNKEEKENEFRKIAKEFESEYGKEMIKEFCDYWTESNPKGKRLKFELQKTFDISRRLLTWSKNNFNKNGNSKNNAISEERRKVVDAVLESLPDANPVKPKMASDS